MKYHSVFTQYSYYRDFFFPGPASRPCDCTIVDYSPTPGQQESAISWKYYHNCLITITGLLCCFFKMRDIFTLKNIETHYTVII